jgi:hypothetical protein
MRNFYRVGAASCFALVALAACSQQSENTNQTRDVSSRSDIPDGPTSEVVRYPEADFLLTSTSIGSMSPAEGTTTSAAGDFIVISGGPGIETAPSYGRTAGAIITLPEGIEQAASGRRVIVTVSARSETSNRIALSYSTNEVGNSGWQVFDISSEFAEYSFEYNVAPMNAGNRDYLGILPDASGAGGTIEVQWLSVDTIDRP